MNNIKIGVLFTAYNCAEYIDGVFEPWLKLKKELNLVIAATNGRYILSPKEDRDMKGSHSLLKLIGKNIDFLVHSSGTDHFWTEEQSRDYMARYALDQGVDIIWMVDADEFYSEENIKNIISFIQGNPNADSYHVNFKNYVIKYPYWTDGFNKSVIYWVNRKSGINKFYFDNEIIYNDGSNSEKNQNKLHIPKSVAHIEHYSWLENDPRTKDKIENQNIKYNGEPSCKCSFEYKGEKLIFNRSFFSNRNLELPILHKTLEKKEYIGDIDYSRRQNAVFIKNVFKQGSLSFSLRDENLSLQCKGVLEVNPGGTYYLAPANDLRNQKFLNLTLSCENEIILIEDLYLTDDI